MVLRGIEQKIEALFEGVFGRAFRTNVQPVELARKLAKEMDDHKTVSVSRIYVPNEYTIYLSTADREQFESYETSLLSELEEYLVEHAKRESYALLTAPLVKLETDDDLAVGEFGIATRVMQPRRARHGPEEPPDERLVPGATVDVQAGRRGRRAASTSAALERGSPRRGADLARPAAARRAGDRRDRAGTRLRHQSSRTRTSPAATRSSGSEGPRSGSSTSTRRTASR